MRFPLFRGPIFHCTDTNRLTCIKMTFVMTYHDKCHFSTIVHVSLFVSVQWKIGPLNNGNLIHIWLTFMLFLCSYFVYDVYKILYTSTCRTALPGHQIWYTSCTKCMYATICLKLFTATSVIFPNQVTFNIFSKFQ